MDTETFLQTSFLNLPWNTVSDICQLLPSGTVSEILLKVPSLRNVIVDQYYQQEVHLILSPTKRPHFCTPDPQRKEIIDIVTYAEIEDFLVENPDIVPCTYKVITSGDFRSMEILLKTFRSRLAQADRLEIYVENYEFSGEDVELIFSFPNLSKLQTSHIKLRKCLGTLSRVLPESQSLRELIFLGHEITNWCRIQFPPNLTHLDMSWYPDTDVTSVILPPSISNLYWNQTGIKNAVFDGFAYPPFIKTLMLTYNSLHTVNVSQLPATLETIDLSYNNIQKFEYDSSHPFWPANLKSVLLNANLIDDSSLEQLSAIAWPPFLENLRLDQNKLTSLEHLTDLPESLRYLDLSDTQLKKFNVAHNDDKYAFFKFPDSLDTLNFQGCNMLTYNESLWDGKVLVEDRIQFPPRLESLNLTECNVTHLAYFLFPSSLKTLSLTGNKLKDLTTYNLSFGEYEVVNWTQLVNLRDLELYYNEIEELRSWCPPKSLRRVDLRRNAFKHLVSAATPLFQREFREFTDNIQFLNFEENEIRDIDPALHLPRNLLTLNLSKNNLLQFQFSAAIASHMNLFRLDLGHNYIRSISVDRPGEQYASHLKQLNLARNTGTQFHMTTAEFYGVLESIGLVITKKKHNIKSEHVFR